MPLKKWKLALRSDDPLCMPEPVTGSRLQSIPDDLPSDAPLCLGAPVDSATEIASGDGEGVFFADESPQYLSPAVERLLSKYEPRGASVELLSQSVQTGAQNEAQVSLERVTLAAADGSLEVCTLAAEIHGGVHNPDGSIGHNVGFSLNALSAELSAEASGNSLTVGVSIGPGVEGSVGTRDADGDGRAEACFRAGAGIVTIGACVEPSLVTDAIQETYDNVTAAIAGWVRL